MNEEDALAALVAAEDGLEARCARLAKAIAERSGVDGALSTVIAERLCARSGYYRWNLAPPVEPDAWRLREMGEQLAAGGTSLDASPALAIVVAEASRAPEDSRILRALTTIAGFVEPPTGTIHAWLCAGNGDGLQAPTPRGTLHLDWIDAFDRGRDLGMVIVALRLQPHDASLAPLFAMGIVEVQSLAALHLPVPVDGRARLRDAFTRMAHALDDEGASEEHVVLDRAQLDEVLDALLPALPPTSFGAWLAHDGAAWLCREADVTAHDAKHADRTLRMQIVAASFEHRLVSPCALRIRARYTLSERAQEYENCLIGAVSDTRLLCEGSWPHDLATVRAALRAWEVASKPALVAAVDEPYYVRAPFAWSYPLAAIARWHIEGPPPELASEPDTCRWREAVARWKSSIRVATDEERAALRAQCESPLVAAFWLGSFAMCAAPDCHVPGKDSFREEELFVVDPEGRALAIACNDPWNGHFMPVDGNRRRLLDVASFLRELVLANAHDPSWVTEGANYERTVRLSEWLTFPRPPMFTPAGLDWRVEGGPPQDDFVSSFDYASDGPFGFSDEQQAAIRAKIDGVYYRFIREVIDAGAIFM